VRYLPFVPIENSQLIVFGLLSAAIVSVWIPKDCFNWRYAYGSIGLFLLALFAAAFYGYVGLIASPFILLFAGGFVLLRQERFLLKFFGTVLIGVLSIGFMLHTVPGFHNPALIKNATISPDGVPYSQNLNFDKALIGFFYLLLGTTVIRTLHEVKESAKIYGVGVWLILACATEFRRHGICPSRFEIWRILFAMGLG